MLGLLKKHWRKLIVCIFIVLIIPVSIERVLFAIGKWIPLTTAFSPDQILNYFVAISVLITTVILGVIVWKQNQAIHTMNSDLQQKNMDLTSLSIKQNEAINEINTALQKQNIEIAEMNMLYTTYNYSSIKYIAFQISSESVITLNKENKTVRMFNNNDEVQATLDKLGLSIKDIPLEIYRREVAKFLKIGIDFDNQGKKCIFDLHFLAMPFRDVPIKKINFNGFSIWIDGVAKFEMETQQKEDLFINNNFKVKGTSDANHSFNVPLQTNEALFNELISDIKNHKATLVMGLTYINMFKVNFNCLQTLELSILECEDEKSYDYVFNIVSEHISVQWLEVREEQ